MTNKILSLIFSVMLVTSLVGVTSVSAQTAERTVLYEEDFQNFSTKAFNVGYNASGTNYAVTDANEASRLSVGNFFKTEIVEMTGYDGNPTEAVKITGNHDSSLNWTTSAGAARITLSGLSAGLASATSGTLVYEYKVYSPNAVNSAGETLNMDIRQYYMSPIVKAGDYYGVGTSSNDKTKKTDIQALTTGQWHKFTYVLLLDEGKVLVYHNDELVSYKVREVTGGGYRFQVPYRSSVEGAHIIFDDFKVWHIAGSADHTAATTVSSDLDGAVEVSTFASPEVTFDEKLLNTVTDGGATVSKDNVIMTTSDGAPVELDSVTLSADGKSLVIDPEGALDYSTLYRVKVKDLLNIYQENIAEYNFSFTTVPEPAYSSTEPVFTIVDLDNMYSRDTEITSLENGYINVNFTVTNNSDTESKDAFVFAVLRDGDALKAIQFKETSISPRDSYNFDAGFTVDNANEQSIEIYAWDSLINKTALVSSFAIDSDGITSTVSN